MVVPSLGRKFHPAARLPGVVFGLLSLPGTGRWSEPYLGRDTS